ncbi:MAG: hypothetical protein ACKO2P_09545 [Planctomycetota bacterium]
MKTFWKVFLCCAAAVACCGTAPALSPPGTPEYQAEMVAIQKMAADHKAYTVDRPAVQMRSNRLSITIPAWNRNGARVTFRALVSRQNRRDGTYFYNVAPPDFVQ